MQIITHSNILNPYDLKVIKSTARHSSQIVKDLLIDDAYEVILAKNSIIQDEPFDIEEGDVINVMFVPKGGGSGGGNKALRSVMMLVVAVASAWTGGAATAAYGSIWGAVAAGGVAIAGSLLVNAVLPTATSTSSLSNSDFSSSTTYSWDESYNKFTQGTPVPKVFGTHKITPPLISKYIQTIDNKQYFNGLYALNDGQITSISDIKINDESIANFDNVTYEIRMGTNDQYMIANFDNTRYDKSIGRKIDTDYTVAETSGDAVTGLTVTLLFDRGLYYAADDGSIANYSVKMVVEISSDGVNWSRVGDSTDIYTPTDDYWVVYSAKSVGHFTHWWLDGNTVKSNSNYLNRNDNTLPWNVKPVTYWGYNGGGDNYLQYSLTTAPYTTITNNTTSTFRKTFSLSGLAPAKYYVRARFYEAPNSSSRYGSECYLEYITEELGDDFTYPGTALLSIRALATDQLSGSMPTISCVVSANSSNPSLVAKQMLLESGYTEARLLPSFDDWATHCTNKGYTFNGVFDTSMTLRKALDLVGTVGRASVVQFGSKFEVIMDRAEEIPVQCFTFGMGNILKDSFKQTFLPILDRANVIEVTYYDSDLDYDPTIVEVSSGNYDSVAEENRTAVTLPGCTDRSQAISYGRYQLNCNRYLTETLEIEADKDSLVCKYGSIVKTSHDTPQYGFSGRITSCTLTHVTLDREVTLESGKSYYIQISDKYNNVKDHLVTNTNNTTDTLTFTSAITDVYEQYDKYAFGEVGKASKLYRVLKISTSSDLKRKLTLLEYNEDVYNDSAIIDVPIISAFGLSNLRATDYIRYAKDGSIETVMQLAWSGSSLYYTIKYKKTTDSVYTSVKSYDNHIDLVVDDTIYDLTVQDQLGNSLSLNYTVLGKLNPPDPVTNLSYIEQQDEFKITWDYELYPIDFKSFNVYVDGVLFSSQKTTTCTIPIKDRKQNVRVYAVDTTGNKSTFTETTLDQTLIDDIEAINVLHENSAQNLYWLKITSTKTPIIYEVRKGESWDYAQVVATTSEAMLKSITSGTYMVKALYVTQAGQKLYSLNPARVIVSSNILPKNIIANFNEHETWGGIKTNSRIYDGNLTLESNVVFDDIADVDSVANIDFPYGSVYGVGYYESTNVIDIGTTQVCKVSASFDAYAENMLNIFDDIVDVDSVENIDGYTANDFIVNIQIAISQDGLIFGGWKPFVAGDYLGQSFKMRMVLIATNQNVRPIVSTFSFTVDMPDIFEQGTATTPTTITFSKPFNIAPKPYTQITISNAVTGDEVELKNETQEGFTLNVKNNGNDVIRTCNWYSSGY